MAALCSGPQCTLPAAAPCPICHTHSYCSPACRAAAWPAHAPSCRPCPALIVDALLPGAPTALRVPFCAHTTVGALVAALRAREPQLVPAAAQVLALPASGAGGEALLDPGDLLASVLQARAGGAAAPSVRLAAAALPPRAALAAPPPPPPAATAAAAPPSSPTLLTEGSEPDAQRLMLNVYNNWSLHPVKMRANSTRIFGAILAKYEKHLGASQGYFEFDGKRIATGSGTTPEDLGMKAGQVSCPSAGD